MSRGRGFQSRCRILDGHDIFEDKRIIKITENMKDLKKAKRKR